VNPNPEVSSMTWVKPKFEIIDLCSEVTSYLYKR
jgi:coenzyme PQQ precursor peptide PqqA